MHRIASLFKRWLLGTHQGGVAEQHLDSYLDEFVFRFSMRVHKRVVVALVARYVDPYTEGGLGELRTLLVAHGRSAGTAE